MCIYCGTTKYRKIYENHFGSIPVEEDGRTYEIHHIDGNHSNNDPSNLKAMTLQEHYDIHYNQGDYLACYLMSVQRMNKSPEEISVLSSKAANQRILNGTHHFMGDLHPSKIRSKNGTHFFYTNKFIFDGELNGNFNHSVFTFINTETDEKVSMTMNKFSKTYSLPISNVCSMISGNRKRVGKWTLLGRDHSRKKIYNTKIYKFINIETSEIVEMTRQQFISLFGADKGALSKLISGDSKSVKGWAVLHD